MELKGKKFVVVGGSGTILTSSDSNTWISENSGTSNLLSDVIYENGTLIDEPHGEVDLAQSGLNIVDAIAILNVGSFKTWTRKVLTHSGNTFTYEPVPEWKTKHHDYFLEGKLSFLDSEGEWFLDTLTNELYFWPPDNSNPNNLQIRGKVQSYAFNISNSDYVHIKNIEFENKIAKKVNFWTGDKLNTVEANSEIILSAGTIGSPHILQASGLGPAKLLKDNGIEVLMDHKSIGQNLIDHLMLRPVYKICLLYTSPSPRDS